MKRAVFLDRDGTLNHDPGYLNDPEKLELFSGVGEGLRVLQDAGFLLVIVSNQSGVGRGLITQDQIKKVHHRLDALLAEKGVKITQYQLCYHRPEENCLCRKPHPKLLLDAARQLSIQMSESYMIGDKYTDVLAGEKAGCKASVLVKTGEGEKELSLCQKITSLYVAEHLLDASRWIISQPFF